jgi:hypothetical protein
MKSSPFIYGTTVADEAFINRRKEIKKMVDDLTGGINITLISPRRWGKTSLVEKVASVILKKNKNIRIAFIDLFTVSSEEQFMEKYAREIIKASSSKWQEWAKNARTFFKLVIPRIHIGLDPARDFNISFDWQEMHKHDDEILNLPETIARQKGIKIIVCIDEFQNIANFHHYESFEKKIRAIWQRQSNVTYCIYGSRRHMMTEIFNNPSKPFYRFGDMMILQKIEKAEWIRFIQKNFQKTGKKIGTDEASLITELMQCHSWYTQQLAHYTWNLTSGIASKFIIRKALRELIGTNIPFYQKLVESLSITQLNLLKAVAWGEIKFTSAGVMADHSLGTPRNVSKNKALLVNSDMIQAGTDRYEFVDPAFELWFRNNFLDQSYEKLLRELSE